MNEARIREKQLVELDEFKKREHLSKTDVDNELYPAVDKKNWALVKFLLEKDANPYMKKPYSVVSVFSLIAEQCNIEIVQIFIAKNISIRERNEALIASCLSGRLEMVKYLVQNKANVNSKDSFGYSPLMRAAMSSLETVIYLVENNAQVNMKDIGGNTALSDASSICALEIVQYLIKHGANIHSRSNNGYSILKHAQSQECRNGTIEYLKSIGAK